MAVAHGIKNTFGLNHFYLFQEVEKPKLKLTGQAQTFITLELVTQILTAQEEIKSLQLEVVHMELLEAAGIQVMITSEMSQELSFI